MLLVQLPKDWYKKWRTWKWEDEWRLSKLLLCWDRPEYFEESWKLEKTCCHSNSSEKPSADGKKPSKSKILIIIKELKKLWNMKVTLVSTLIGGLGNILMKGIRGLEVLKIGGRSVTIVSTELLRSATVQRRILETWGHMMSLRILWKTNSKRLWEILSRNDKYSERKKLKKNITGEPENTYQKSYQRVEHFVKYSGRFLKWTREELY